MVSNAYVPQLEKKGSENQVIDVNGDQIFAHRI